jgi:hypothetical protein
MVQPTAGMVRGPDEERCLPVSANALLVFTSHKRAA